MNTRAHGAGDAGTGVLPGSAVPGVDPAWVEHLASFAVTSPYAQASTVVAPATGEVLATVPRSTLADVGVAYAGARAVQPGWSYIPPAARGAILLGFHDLLLARQVEILDLLQRETGKSRRAAFEEIVELCTAARFYARKAEAVLRPRRQAGVYPVVTRTLVARRPVGVVGVIASASAPLAAGMVDVVAALVGGNAVVLRPDPEAPLTALLAAELLQEAGLPPRLLQVVLGPGEVVGTAVIDHADHVGFTGSRAVGREVATRAGARLIPMSVQVVGAGAGYVAVGSDLFAAAEGLAWVLTSSHSASRYLHRIVVDASVAATFTALLGDAVARVVAGPELTYDTHMGSLAGPAQLEAALDRIERLRRAGAQVLVGGNARPDLGPWFVEPTVLTTSGTDEGASGVPRASAEPRVMEMPVPVALVVPVEGGAAAKRALRAEPGVTAVYVWDRDLDRAERLGHHLDAGAVFVNGRAPSMAGGAAPTGGTRGYGFGRRGGIEGILAYTEPQALASWRGPGGRWLGDLRDEQRAGRSSRMLRVMRRLGSA